MSDKEIRKMLEYILNVKTPIVIDDKYIYEIMKKFPHYILSASCSDKELYGETHTEYHAPKWSNYLDNNKNEKYLFLLIEMDNSTIDEQRRFISLIKDRSIQVLNIPDNCHIILVSNNTKEVDKELLGYTLRV